MVTEYGVYWADLNPVVGSEISKTRPCVIISPEALNKYLRTVIVVPLTSTIRNYPFRVRCHVMDKDGELAVDQLRCIDKSRLRGEMTDRLSSKEIENLRKVLEEMFC